MKIKRIIIEAPETFSRRVKIKCVKDMVSIKEVGIRLFDKWLNEKIKLPKK